MEAELFDPSELQSRLQRTLCETLLGRGQEVAASMASAYLPGKTPPVMRFEYHRSMYFNAFAQSGRGRHVVGINIAAVVLLQVLFQRLLSSADFLPELPEVDRAIGGWKVPFVNDVGAGMIDASVPIRLDDDRFFVAFILQDFCCSFVLMHEIAHVICGHTGGARHFFGKGKVEEFFGLWKWLRRGRYLKTAWEHDADVVASSLLCQYIRHFLTADKGPGVESAFRFVGKNLAKLTGLVTGALFAMFAYLARMEYRLNLKSHHPHPMLRTKYIGQTILRRMAADEGLDRDEIYEWQTEYMSQVAQELEGMGLFDWDAFDREFRDTDAEVTRLIDVSGRLRGACERWAWLPLDRWETMA